MELCTGMQENEKEFEEFIKENPDFPHYDVLNTDFDEKINNNER